MPKPATLIPSVFNLVKAELSSDNYKKDRYLSKYTAQNQYNYGAEYELNEAIDISAYYLNEKEMGLRIKISADPKNSNPGNFMEPVPQPFYSFQFRLLEICIACLLYYYFV